MAKNLIILLLTAVVVYCMLEKYSYINNKSSKCLDTICKTYTFDDLTTTVSGAALKAMSESYAMDKSKSMVHNQNGTSVIDTSDATSIVFELSTIKALIYMMEETKCKNKCDDKVRMGIRYYYIKYPDNFEVPPYSNGGLAGMDSKYHNKHSLAMVPVVQFEGNKDWQDFDLRRSSPTDCFPAFDLQSIEEEGRDPKSNERTFVPLVMPLDAGENHGGMAPPPYPGTFPIK
ncbi:MAG: hypothetical protein IPI42_01950 [Saprospiraceae bacterium]|nr:hypothetical protein [Candidatus Parvibacillus calidus]